MPTEDTSRISRPVGAPGLIGLYALTVPPAVTDDGVLILYTDALNRADGQQYLDAAMDEIRARLPDHLDGITWIFDGPYDSFPQSSMDRWLFPPPVRV